MSLTPDRQTLPPAPQRPGLHRSRRQRMLGGVCGGLAETFGGSPWIYRVVFVLGNFLPGPGLLVYLILWLSLPLDRSAP